MEFYINDIPICRKTRAGLSTLAFGELSRIDFRVLKQDGRLGLGGVAYGRHPVNHRRAFALAVVIANSPHTGAKNSAIASAIPM